MQQALATISYSTRGRMKELASKIESFDDFALLPSIKQAVAQTVLEGMVDIKPSPVQKLAIPALLSHYETFRRQSESARAADIHDESVGTRNPNDVEEELPNRGEFLLAAETGSGKTLAYLLPAVNAIKQDEAADEMIIAYNKRREAALQDGLSFEEPHPTMARPRVVVLVPSAELVEQVGSVAKKLCHIVKFKVQKLSSAHPKTIHKRMYSPAGVDMVVITPHLLASMADSDPNVLSRVTHLIIDEADSLMDRSFIDTTTAIIDRASPSLRQLILCSATIPKRLDTMLATHYPDMVRITTPNLHAIPRRVQLGVVDLTAPGNRQMTKDQACADAIWTIGRDAQDEEHRIIVFVNEREKTRELADYLVSKGIDAVALSRDEHDERAKDKLAAFTQPLKKPEADSSSPSEPISSSGKVKRTLNNTKVIVATDLASRGIDTVAVRRVILYDVPHTTIDFIHRLGRAGRMGRRGRGIVLVDKHDRKDIVAEVRGLMFAGQALI